jgi:hypothetical protein
LMKLSRPHLNRKPAQQRRPRSWPKLDAFACHRR